MIRYPNIFPSLLLLSIFCLVACDRPAKKLDNYQPKTIEFIFTEGGKLKAKDLSYNESDNSLSKKTKTVINTVAGEEPYKIIYDFLKQNNKVYGLFNKVDIPYYHVIVAYVSFSDRNNNKQTISIGNSWLAYYVHVDSLGETSNVLYSSSKKKVDDLLIKLGSFTNL